MVIEGNKPTCMRGNVKDEVEKGRRPVSPTSREPKVPKNQQKLVRVGSKLYGKDTHSTRKFNVGFRVNKTATGLEFQTRNEIESIKERTFKPVNPKKLHACPGEAVRPLTPLPEEKEE